MDQVAKWIGYGVMGLGVLWLLAIWNAWGRRRRQDRIIQKLRREVGPPRAP